MVASLVIENGSGMADANSYASVAEADAYHEAHLYPAAWDAVSDPQTKIKALIMATRVLDAEIQWDGVRATHNQALGWPRTGVFTKDGQLIASIVIPVNLKHAVSELARHLIVKDRTAERDTLGVKSVKVEGVAVEFDKTDAPNALPDSVISLVRAYGSVEQTAYGSFKLTRC